MGSAKKKSGGMSFKTRLGLIVFVLIFTATFVVWLLNRLGIVTYDDLMIRAGLKEKPAVSPVFQIHFVDVGQGDCTVVICGGQVMVIDSGDRDDSNRAIGYLRSLGIRDIDYLIATHPHADHIGEMAEIINGFNVKKFIMPRSPDELIPTTRSYEEMLDALSAKGMKITAASDTSFSFGEHEECRADLITSHLENADDLNNYSVLVRLTHGDNSFLVTGDCEKEEEADILSRGTDLRAKVLRAGHHGSSTSSTAEFLDAVDPKYAVISCGLHNDYGHPNKTTVNRLAKYADKIYVTAEVGSVVFTSDGEGLSIETRKTGK